MASVHFGSAPHGFPSTTMLSHAMLRELSGCGHIGVTLPGYIVDSNRFYDACLPPDQNRMQHAINVQSGHLQGCFHRAATHG